MNLRAGPAGRHTLEQLGPGDLVHEVPIRLSVGALLVVDVHEAHVFELGEPGGRPTVCPDIASLATRNASSSGLGL